METDPHEDDPLGAKAEQAATSSFLARQQAEKDLARANAALESKTRELAHSLAVMRATLESTTDGILVTTDSGEVTCFNEKFLQMWGIPRELVGTGAAPGLLQQISQHFENPAEYKARVQEILTSSPAESYDLLERLDGKTYERFSRIQWVDQRKAGRVWSFRDITDHKKVEAEVRQQRAWFEVTLSSIGDAVITTDRNGKITFLNPVAQNMTGWQLEEAFGRSLEEIFRIVDEHTGRPAVNPVGKVLREGIIVGLANHTALISRQGTRIPVEDSAAPIRDPQGRVSGAVIVFHDVTERRRAENALRENRERLEAALAAAKTATFFWNIETHALEGDENLDRLFGLEAPAGIRTLKDLIATVLPEHRRRVADYFEACTRPAAEFTLDFPIVGKEGEVRWIHSQGRPIQRSGGQPLYLAGACLDITERRRAEEARSRLAALVESSDDAIVSKTLAGIITTWNRGAERMFGYTADEIIGQPVTVLIPKDRLDEENTILERLRGGHRIESYETVRRRKDGRLLDVALTVSPIRDSNGEIIGASKIARDVTARKRTESALREEYRVTEKLNEIAKDLATELDPASIVRIIADAGRGITRAEFAAFYQCDSTPCDGAYTLHTLSGISESAFEQLAIPPAKTFFTSINQGGRVLRLDDIRADARFAGEPFHNPTGHQPLSYLAVTIASRSGEILGGLLLGHSRPAAFTEHDERILAGVAAQAAAAMDTARLYQAEQQARSAAEHANRAKDLFLAALSHELRTPLTPALAILSFLCQERSLPPDLKVSLETVRRNVELEARLIDDLLDLTRITHGKLELHCEHIRIGQILDDVINTCRPDLEAKQLRLVMDVENPGQTILVDGARITQILWNLVKNAIKFTPNDGTITIRTRLGPPGGEPHIAIEVDDTGIGIEPTHTQRIFEAFEQGDRETTRQFGGLGLGLAISRAIAGYHKGTLIAKSEGKGRGSTFILTLPIIACDEEDIASPAASSGSALSPTPAETAAPPTARPKRILLVEDHLDTAKALGALLRRGGFQVTLASDVAGALEIARTEPFDVVMSDLGLPDGSGYELMRQLRDLHSIPGIALSGYGMEEDIQKCYEAGFSEHLVKPVQIAKLQAALNRLLSLS